MAIEVPDTRGVGGQPPTRRRARPAKAAPVPDAAAEPAAERTFKPVRRRAKPAPAPDTVVDALEPTVPEPAGESTFKAVRRRPRRAPADDAAPQGAATAEALPALTAPSAREEHAEPQDAVSAEALPALAAPSPVAVENFADADEPDVEAVVAHLGGTRYALEMDAIAEVGRVPSLTRVPGMPSWVAGVANWRGRVLAVLDLRPLLGAPQSALPAGARVVVLAREGVTLAVLTERVEGVVPIDVQRMEPALLTLSVGAAQLVAGQVTTHHGPIAVLDLETVFALRNQLPRVRRAG